MVYFIVLYIFLFNAREKNNAYKNTEKYKFFISTLIQHFDHFDLIQTTLFFVHNIMIIFDIFCTIL